MGRTRFAILLALCLTVGAVGNTAAAQDAEVVKRLTKYGKLSKGEAKRVAKDLSKRMKRAADMTNQRDPLRMAVSQALFNTPAPADQMASAKVRLRLYAGLNAWALDNLFKPRPGAIQGCVANYGASSKQCEALVAAGGKVSLADARKQGAGAAIASGQPRRFGQPQQQQRFGQPQPRRFGQQPRRFGQQPQRFGQQPQRFGQPAARPAPRRAARPAPRPAARPMGPHKSVAQRKAEYQARRQAYLERKKAEMEARKAKIVGSAGGERVERGLVSGDDAEAMGIDGGKDQQPTASAAPRKEKQVAAATPAEATPEPEKPKKKPKAALDDDLLGDLLGNPLGD